LGSNRHGDTLLSSVGSTSPNQIDTSTLPLTAVSVDSNADPSANVTTVDSNQNNTEQEWQSYNITSPDFSTFGTTDVSYANVSDNANNNSDQNASVAIVETFTVQPLSYPSTVISSTSTSSVTPQ
jgi:putative lipase involved disintegration of autophagic bodies